MVGGKTPWCQNRAAGLLLNFAGTRPEETDNVMASLPKASPAPRGRNAVAPLARIIERRYGGRNLPVALVLPDGTRVALSESADVDVLARTWRGLKALATPALGSLA